MSRPFILRVLTDGKPGHQNQSLGLAEAIARLRPAVIDSLPLPSGRLRSFAPLPTPTPLPDLFIGAGHSTHAPLLQLSRRTGVPCVVLMKPSLPVAFFDLCLVPGHDLGTRTPPPNVIATCGALNRVPPPGNAPRHHGLILIGGPSNSHLWDAGAVRDCVTNIAASRPERTWKITDSRRTPDGCLADLIAHAPGIQAWPHQETPPSWLPAELAGSAETWVTEDSVSMIYEALSSGSGVGLLPVPAKRKESRVSRGIARLVNDGWVTPFCHWQPGTPLPLPPATLREADRCAAIVLERLLLPRR